MSRTTFILIGVLYYIFTIVIIVVVLNLINKKERQKYKDEITTLERDKNLIVGASILSELNKVGALINNDIMQKKYDNWCLRLKEIKEIDKKHDKMFRKILSGRTEMAKFLNDFLPLKEKIKEKYIKWENSQFDGKNQ